MSAVVRLRETVLPSRSWWDVEVWRHGALAGPSSSYPDRRIARAFAGHLARELGAVVILAGPDRPVSLVPDEDLPF